MEAFSTNNQKRFCFHCISNVHKVCDLDWKSNISFLLCGKYNVADRLNLQLVKTLGDLL